MNFNNEEDLLALLNRLLEMLHQAGDNNHQGGIVLNIYEKGSQHVDHVDNQYFYRDVGPNPPQKGREKGSESKEAFSADTPLSALFRESHHEELRKIIDSWRPYLVDDDPSTDALALTSFEFDFDKVIATQIYIDLGRLLYAHALKDNNMNLLAKYLFQHTNLSNSQSTLYVQLRKYKKR